ncbi:hypothetical protein AGMMS49959_17790 [Planctomycetales bacterium]|nr:hypothetical protein AGMMS49959_17790 [Planctomycetales bacterium]
MNNQNYLKIVQHYEKCLEQYGDSFRGVDWPNEKDAETRYRVMTEVIRERKQPITLLDFGCGTARHYDFLLSRGACCLEGGGRVIYSGLDISEKFTGEAKRKYPYTKFYTLDILADGSDQLPLFDYIILNGVFTEKRELDFETMWNYFTRVLTKVFALAKKGVAFNVMAKAVDWERGDLFHLPTDRLIEFMTKNLSRHFVIRNDYGLYEYTTYLYQENGG